MVKKVIFLSGVSGSGKSTLAKKLAEENNGIILSTDDFFMKDGEYRWSGSFIKAAHEWNRGRFYKAVFDGATFIIIDNTNLQAWQMFPYVEFLVAQGFEFEIIEPKTKWKNDAEELAKRNTRNVPLSTIEKMLAEKQTAKEMDKELRQKFCKVS